MFFMKGVVFMEDIIFGDFESYIFEKLKHARKSVKIAVAWLNFNIYGQIFSQLLNHGIKVSIIVNADFKNINANTRSIINFLINNGAFIKYIKMPTPFQYMHHKFCIIDNTSALIGSYNWTKNAARNFENLMCIENPFIVSKLKDEFKLLKHISNKDIYELQNFELCPECKQNKVNLVVLNLDTDKYSTTQYTIYSLCDCGIEELTTDYLDGAFYFTLRGIGEQFDNQIEECMSIGHSIDEIKERYDYEVEKLIKSVFGENFMIPIHGVGIYHYDITSQDGDGEWITSIVWKNRFAEKFVSDVYYDFEM